MRALLIVLALCTTGCPGIKRSSGTSTTCSEQFQRCKLPNGPLGVCDLGPCKDNETAKCLRCVPQH
jgi:hypothetical protein